MAWFRLVSLRELLEHEALAPAHAYPADVEADGDVGLDGFVVFAED